MSLLKLRSSSKPAKKSRLAVEQLEDRVVPAISFAQYANGTYAYNTTTNQFRQISTAQGAWPGPAGPAKAMDEGADGTLFASYSSGTFRYNYSSNVWTKLSTAQSSELSAANDNTLFASFNSGTWEYDSTGWHKMTTAVATQLAAVRDNSFYGDFSGGLSKYKDGVWSNLTTARTTGAMDASLGGTLFVSHASGTWRYREANSFTGAPAGWTKMTVTVASDIAVVNSRTFYATSSSGTWRADGDAWTKIADAKATNMAADSTSFVGTFSDAAPSHANGTWEYRPREFAAWAKITTAHASLMA